AELCADLQTLKRDVESGHASDSERPQSPATMTNSSFPSPEHTKSRSSKTPPTGTRTARTPRTIDSLAVLPFENVSRDAEHEYLSDGITASLINILATVPKLRVMAQSTVFRYKGREIDPQAVGRELNIRAVLTGRIVQSGGSLRIGAELVDVATG